MEIPTFSERFKAIHPVVLGLIQFVLTGWQEVKPATFCYFEYSYSIVSGVPI